jgi:peptidoglycan/LPS O-acetylase OafA/YrhL
LPAGGIYPISQRQPPTKELLVSAALLLSFGVIFVAELGDKSQLTAMTFVLRHRSWVLLGGITAATTAVYRRRIVPRHPARDAGTVASGSEADRACAAHRERRAGLR